MNIERSYSNPLVSLIRRSMFWRPTFQNGSDWLGFAPFAFWLVDALRPARVVEIGTTSANSYFSFCQALSALQIPAEALALVNDDLWSRKRKIQLIQSHNSLHFAGFSKVISARNAEEGIDEASIDLLHINLCDPSALEEMVQNWLPKLSSRGVVVIRERESFGEYPRVSTFLKDLRQRFPHFELTHSEGVLVIQVGATQSGVMTKLYQCYGTPAYEKVVKEVFSSLGQGCLDSFDAGMARAAGGRSIFFQSPNKSKRIRKANVLPSEESGGISGLDLTAEGEPYDSRAKSLLHSLEAYIAQVRDVQHSESGEESYVEAIDVALSESEFPILRDLALSLRQRDAFVFKKATQEAQISSRAEEANLLAGQLEDAAAQVEELRAALTYRDEQIETAKAALQKSEQEVARFRDAMQERFSEIAKLTKLVEEISEANVIAKSAEGEASAKLKSVKSTTNKKVQTMEALVNTLETELERVQGELSEANAQWHLAQNQMSDYQAKVAGSDRVLIERASKIDELENELGVLRASLDAASQSRVEAEERVKKTVQQLSKERANRKQAEDELRTSCILPYFALNRSAKL